MSDVVELKFRPAAIMARYRDGSNSDVGGVSGAVRMLAALAAGQLSVSIESDDARALAEQTADLAGMVITEQDGNLFLLRPGHAPEAITVPEGTFVQPRAKYPPAIITLSPGNLFSHAEPAYQELIATIGGKAPTRRFHNYLTETFRAGTPVGQINSLYRDLKSFGYAAIEDKLLEWADYVRHSVDPEYRRFFSWYSEGVLPHDMDVLRDSRLVMPYFKAWAMLRLVTERAATAR